MLVGNVAHTRLRLQEGGGEEQKAIPETAGAPPASAAQTAALLARMCGVCGRGMTACCPASCRCLQERRGGAGGDGQCGSGAAAALWEGQRRAQASRWRGADHPAIPLPRRVTCDALGHLVLACMTPWPAPTALPQVGATPTCPHPPLQHPEEQLHSGGAQEALGAAPALPSAQAARQCPAPACSSGESMSSSSCVRFI